MGIFKILYINRSDLKNIYNLIGEHLEHLSTVPELKIEKPKLKFTGKDTN